jgi:AcrR family transcriptional regulator
MRRAERKELTRQKVLDAARDLFAAEGYEAATLRRIAERAEVSVGSVFTTFDSKEDVLFAIAAEGYDALAAVVAAEADGPGSARERLKRGFAAAYAFQYERLGLLMVQVGASWTWSRAFEAASQARLARPFGFIVTLVQSAHANGEIRANVDPALLSDVLLGVYLRGLRHGWYRELSPAQMADFTAGQIDLIFEGAASRLAGA